MSTNLDFPARDDCVVAYQLEKWARLKPDRVVMCFRHEGGGDDEEWTWSETLDRARRAAKGFADLGVVKGEPVLSYQPNGPDATATWFGLNYLGAVYVPTNVGFRGSLLEGVVSASGATRIVCHADLLDYLAAIDTATLTDVIVTGNSGLAVERRSTTGQSGVRFHPASTLTPRKGLKAIPNEIDPGDAQYGVFTAGVTQTRTEFRSYQQGYLPRN